MDKKVLIPMLGILLLLSLTGLSYGVRSGMGISAGYALPANTNFAGGLMYGVNFCVEITQYFAIELSGLRFQSNVTGAADSLSDGKLTVMPVQLSIQGRYPINKQFVPYVSGGGGYYVNSFAIDSQITDAWNAVDFDIEEKIENAIGFHIGAGIDYFFNRRLAINADFKYCICKTTGSWSLTDRVTAATTSGDIDDIDLNIIMITAGVKIFF